MEIENQTDILNVAKDQLLNMVLRRPEVDIVMSWWCVLCCLNLLAVIDVNVQMYLMLEVCPAFIPSFLPFLFNKTWSLFIYLQNVLEGKWCKDTQILEVSWFDSLRWFMPGNIAWKVQKRLSFKWNRRLGEGVHLERVVFCPKLKSPRPEGRAWMGVHAGVAWGLSSFQNGWVSLPLRLHTLTLQYELWLFPFQDSFYGPM